MKKQILALIYLFALTLIFNVPSFAQDADAGEFKGYILDDKGKKKEGVIKLASTRNPWENQRTVFFVSQKTWDKSKGELKKKDWEKFKSKDVEGYGFDGREFFTVKYTATSDGGGDVNKLTGGMSAVSNLTRNKHCLERILDGKVQVFRYYEYPPDVTAYKGSEKAEYEKMLEDLRTPACLVKKGKKGQMKDFEGMVMFKKYIEDCEVVYNKYMNNEYMYKKNKLKIKDMIKDAIAGTTIEDMCLEIMNEYNAECGK
jgi:hypothetical protein